MLEEFGRQQKTENREFELDMKLNNLQSEAENRRLKAEDVERVHFEKRK